MASRALFLPFFLPSFFLASLAGMCERRAFEVRVDRARSFSFFFFFGDETLESFHARFSEKVIVEAGEVVGVDPPLFSFPSFLSTRGGRQGSLEFEYEKKGRIRERFFLFFLFGRLMMRAENCSQEEWVGVEVFFALISFLGSGFGVERDAMAFFLFFFFPSFFGYGSYSKIFKMRACRRGGGVFFFLFFPFFSLGRNKVLSLFFAETA